MAKRKTPINYTARDFNSIKNELVQYAKRYYPETFRDFNQASFGSLMLDMVSYVGDNLSFYLDYQANESFFDTATERQNIIRHSKQMGYKFKGVPASTGICDFFITVPANSSGLGPDTNYLPILKVGTGISSTSGGSYLLTENINFGDSSNPIVAARVNDTTGIPTSYAVKASGKIVSGAYVVEKKTVGEFQRFRRVYLNNRRATEIVSVVDSQGHEYIEVDYLSQNVVYKEIASHDSTTGRISSALKPVSVPRRYVIEQDGSSVYLQFGFGSDSEIMSDSVADPTNLVLNMTGRDFLEDKSFDPSRLLDTDKFGVAPSSTTLTIVYRVNTVDNVNSASQTVRRVTNPKTEFKDLTKISLSTRNQVVRSIECNNPEPIVGGLSDPSNEEIRRRAIDHFATQNRAVTRLDYESIAYSMPPQFGAIKRCSIMRDNNSFKRNLNMYVLSENSNGTLTQASVPLKDNLKMWLGKSKMIHDTIDIIDGRIVNFGIEFSIIADPDFNKYQVLEKCTRAISNFYFHSRYFGESLYITDIYSVLNKLDGVVDTYEVKFVNREGGVYSDTTYSFESNMSADGRYLSVPKNVCMELKYPDTDIRGAIK
jgi:hypothetical protein